MAHRVVCPLSTRMRGGTLLGFLVGLIAGLSIAVVVAIFVTRAPVPFLNKGNRPAERVIEPKSLSEAPDPNLPLHARVRPSEAVSPPPSTAPGVSAPLAMAPPAAPPGAQPGAPITASPALPSASGDTSYLLQAGAFRSSADAESMKARLALVGFEARVLTAEVNGQTLYRVRVGPYAQLDTMNRARARLAENGIEASVVRQR